MLHMQRKSAENAEGTMDHVARSAASALVDLTSSGITGASRGQIRHSLEELIAPIS